jgi:hypothetical protein
MPTSITLRKLQNKKAIIDAQAEAENKRTCKGIADAILQKWKLKLSFI